MPDFSKYPDEAFQRRWISQYLQARLSVSENNGCADNNAKSDTDEVDFWYKMANKFSLASNLMWCIWSIWQQQNSEIDFDYLEYGIIRWNAYKTRKDEFLAL